LDLVPSAALRFAARAKINLYLHVTGRRDDGYHLLDSLVCFADLGDELAVEAAPELRLSLEGPFGTALAGSDNLVLAAARLMDPAGGAALRLVKQLPVASGMGGGSSDAAAALTGLSRLWQCPMPETERLLALGADLPVCLAPGPSFVGGIGEQLEPAPPLPRFYMLLANPRRPLPTAEVFRRFAGPFSRPARWRDSPADAEQLARLLDERGNDLTEPAMSMLPEIGDLLGAISGSPGCLIARMSGSGASCFGLFAAADEAAKAAAAIQVTQPHWWVRATAIATGGAVAELASG
jgi:4-diphosphocytidyl-2-C-methyl-D-erythritol kinase